MTKRKYYLVCLGNNGVIETSVSDYERSDYSFWIKHKSVIKKDYPNSRVRIYRDKKDPSLVDCILINYPNGKKDYIIAHTKYLQMIKSGKFKLKAG